MGQSLLIDMNSGWYKHKTEFNEGLRTRNYPQCLGALDALNALLPDEYRVIIDNEEYNEKIKGNLVVLCNYCKSDYPDPNGKDKTIKAPTRTEVSKMQKQDLLLSAMDQLISGKRYDTFWQCPKCEKDNKLSQSTFKQSVLRKPFYLQVVPESPLPKPGLEGRTTFHMKFEKWARGFLVELNAQARQFRNDYKGKNDIDEMDGSDNFGEDDDL